MSLTSVENLSLKAALGNHGVFMPVKEGRVTSERVNLEHAPDFLPLHPTLPPGLAIVPAFRTMCRTLEFDITEMAITTYICAKVFDKPFTALPIFPIRGFFHGTVSYNVDSGIKEPKDLEGKRVGIRAYTVTTGVWAKGMLQNEYGVDINKVTWLCGDDHVSEFQAPANVEILEPGFDLGQMLLDGELDAAIGVNVDSPKIKPLIANARQADIARHAVDGLFPINHTVVVKNEFLAEYPWIVDELCEVFKTAKEDYLTAIRAGTKITKQDPTVLEEESIVNGDPRPYGLEANRRELEAIAEYILQQKISPALMNIDDLFAKTDVSFD
jgi:4,5-dihydroxyphthalate decarboxylase